MWTIPPSRMKAKREHRVPLSERCQEILNSARETGEGEFVFPGVGTTGKPLSNMAFLMALRRMRIKTTAHGFRSSFRDWTAERTSFPPEVCEMALAYSIGNKTEAAYRRGDLFEKRRKLMDAWPGFANGVGNAAIPLHSNSERRA